MVTQQYRLHIYDGTYEVLHGRQHLVFIDLDVPGYESTLDRHLWALTRDALAANEPMDAPRMEVRDPAGTVVRNWTAH
ncbi:hypothetical protein [Micromonospora tarensis]|uniref:Uncharacterized protein n=1 Tax=Micromonospora tarensis TaxID=2806100 RepID=A0ABS1YCG8_9ACTN|nr:hypothetical protein [Micromonospora tarensis]MBM0275079.1 hypothetical protein [Micromonospora tarensis]